MRARGVDAFAVDEMELWLIARTLGLDTSSDRQMTEAERRAEDARINAARVHAAATGAPAPTYEPTGPTLSDDQVESTLRELRRARQSRREGVT